MEKQSFPSARLPVAEKEEQGVVEVVEGEVVVEVHADVFSKHRDEQHLVPGVQVHVVAAAGHAGVDFQQTSDQ